MPARGAITLGFALAVTNNTAEAEQVLVAHLKKYGEDGVVLANLARVQAGQGDAEKAAATLWRALEIDPNQNEGLGWYASNAHEKGGIQGAIDALGKVCALPGSWRASLWMARAALENKDVPNAIAHFQSAVDLPDPVPAEALIQITDDLGNAGHVQEAIEIAAPRFRANVHGLQVGNNLIKAYLHLGRIEDARRTMETLQILHVPAWREQLAFWQFQVDEAVRSQQPVPAEEGKLEITLRPLVGPIWGRNGEGFGQLVPQKTAASLRVGVISASVSSTKVENESPEAASQRENTEGIVSRGLAMLLTEQVHLRTTAVGITLFSQITGRPGFAMANSPYPAEVAVRMGGQGPGACHYVVNAHVDASQADWGVTLSIVKVGDGSVVKTIEALLRPQAPGTAIEQLANELTAALAGLEGIQPEKIPAWYRNPVSERWPQALFARTQALVILLASEDPNGLRTLFGDGQILDGLLHLAIDQKADPVSRMLLFTTLARHRALGAQSYLDYGSRVMRLQLEFPLTGETAAAASAMAAFLYPTQPA